VSTEPRRRPLRIVAATLLLTLGLTPALAGYASGEEKLSDLQARLDSIQAELDASAAKIEEAHAQEEELETRLSDIEKEMDRLKDKNVRLRERVSERAAALYMAGSTGIVEVLLTSEDFADLTDNAEILSQVSLDDSGVFVDLARNQANLSALSEELDEKQKQLDETSEVLESESERLQGQFDAVAAEYKDLKEKLAQLQPAPAPAAPAPAPAAASSAPQLSGSGGLICPVGGATSFVDSWGDPRSGGRSHEGVDMMAAYGTPQVAITSGTITYAGYSSLGGNVQYLSGDDGNLYVYIHQASHTVSSGHVSAGQQISVVGDTGNAAGNPHLHFEFHPGGGGPVNPYPLVASLC
jgi:murein DD-endopeptidase MepM/ murein hydrolase activator NlpD